MMGAFAESIEQGLNQEIAAMGRAGWLMIRQARKGDAKRMAKRLDPVDRRELEAATGRDAGSVLKQSLEMTPGRAWVAEQKVNGPWGVHGLFGLASITGHPEIGVPWMVASEHFRQDPKMLLRLGRLAVQGFSREYQVLFNRVHADNTRAIRWLVHIGFDVSAQAVPLGAAGEMFYPFTLKEEVCVTPQALQ